ncbi:MAG: MBOAT family protein, partial [Oscillospiraceae bacterium]|nr:MBOAT family protein [Oscillospiraceae bacterium]
FWRRWHMSLGTFFRDYVYIPLGGNRRFQMRNIFIVWFLTGFWHGASWNFVLWGLYYGVLLTVEKKLLLPLLNKEGDAAFVRILKCVLSHVYTVFITVLGFAIFYFDKDLFKNIGYLFGVGTSALGDMYAASVLFEHLWLLLAACVLACPIIPYLGKKAHELLARLETRAAKEGAAYAIERVYKTLAILLLVGVCTVMMAGDTYSAFLYFRF